MTSKEQVLTAFASQEPDRVPINYSANAGIDQRLKEHFGLTPDDTDGLMQALGVDVRGVGAPYIGPKLHDDMLLRGVKVDNWGIHRRWVEHDTGGYWDYCDFPLRDADDETIACCRRTLDIMTPGGGYCFAPTHSLQDNSPTENVVAMYNTAHEYGTY